MFNVRIMLSRLTVESVNNVQQIYCSKCAQCPADLLFKLCTMSTSVFCNSGNNMGRGVRCN